MTKQFDATLHPDGNVAVPAEIRAFLDLEPGQDLRFLLHDDGVVELVNPRPAVSDALDPDYVDALHLARIDGRGADVMILLSKGVPTGVLQEVGLGMLVALEQNQPGAADVATTTAHLLDERSWRGDRELAELLRARAAGQDRGRPSVPADLETLAEILDRDPHIGFGGFLNLDDGEVMFSEMLDGDPELAEEIDGGNWLNVPSDGSRSAWRDMQFFAELQEPRIRQRLEAAIDGRGAFRRFGNVVYDDPVLREAWNQLSSERTTGRAVEWLMAAGYDVAPRLGV